MTNEQQIRNLEMQMNIPMFETLTVIQEQCGLCGDWFKNGACFSCLLERAR